MGYCPYFNQECYGSTNCSCWDDFGCSVRCRPGIPAVRSGTNVYILHIQYGDPKGRTEEVVVYADATTGAIGESDDITEFTIYIP